MRIISANVIDNVLVVATFDGKHYRRTAFGGILRAPHETCAVEKKSDFCTTWQGDGVAMTLTRFTSLRALAYFWEKETAYLTHVNAPQHLWNGLYQLFTPDELPDNAKLSEWAKRWVTFTKEAALRGDRAEDIVCGCRFLPY